MQLLPDMPLTRYIQVLRIMRSHGFGDIQIVKDLNNIPRVVYGTRVETI